MAPSNTNIIDPTFDQLTGRNDNYTHFRNELRELQKLLQLSDQCRSMMDHHLGQSCAVANSPEPQKFYQQPQHLSGIPFKEDDKELEDEELTDDPTTISLSLDHTQSSSILDIVTEKGSGEEPLNRSFFIDKFTALRYNVPRRLLVHDQDGRLIERNDNFICTNEFVEWWIKEGPTPSESGLKKIVKFFRRERNRAIEILEGS